MIQQFITRPKKYEKEEPSKKAKKVYIFCEGKKTEPKYFKFFKNLDSRIDIISIPNENGQSDPLKLKERVEKLFFADNVDAEYRLEKEYEDEIWFVIDTDKWGSKIDDLRSYVESKKDYSLRIAQSNPCFEIWLYYHFHKEKPSQTNVNSYNTFKEFVSKNINRGTGFKSENTKFLERAIQNTENNHSENGNPPQPDLYCTQVFHLGKSILPFVKDKL